MLSCPIEFLTLFIQRIVWNQELVFWFWNQDCLESRIGVLVLESDCRLCVESRIGVLVLESDCRLCLESTNGSFELGKVESLVGM
ncbi:hypothetical protein H5410_020266 [Solanum commersonii]|uniref:Uncharacterized protein n=1 Tax=Solanum commersonii TaxID=4109 RepID=A0A9J5Z7Y8_SOLCO|nr:hypothetical protein H5410_020266 [Solanum commersonii]